MMWDDFDYQAQRVREIDEEMARRREHHDEHGVCLVGEWAACRDASSAIAVRMTDSAFSMLESRLRVQGAPVRLLEHARYAAQVGKVLGRSVHFDREARCLRGTVRFYRDAFLGAELIESVSRGDRWALSPQMNVRMVQRGPIRYVTRADVGHFVLCESSLRNVSLKYPRTFESAGRLAVEILESRNRRRTREGRRTASLRG